MQHLSDPAQAAISTLRSALAQLDDLRSQPEREIVYSALVAHIRSATPMQLLTGAADLIEPVSKARVQLAAGSSVEVSAEENAFILYAVDPTGRDVGVEMSAAQKEELRDVLGRVR